MLTVSPAKSDAEARTLEFIQVAQLFLHALRPTPRLRTPGMPPPDRLFFLLKHLYHHEQEGRDRQRQRDIGSELRLAAPTVSLMLGDLEKEGYVERLRDTQDRRVVRVRLTEKGKQMFDQHLIEYQEHTRKLLACLEEEELSLLIALMQKVSASADRTDPVLIQE